MLNIRELLIGKPVRLRYVNRFNTCRVMKIETVAEHSYFVTLYTLMICKWCGVRGTQVDTENALARAIFHDLEEAATGDVPRTFKYSDKSLCEHLNKVALDGLLTVIENLWEAESFMTKNILDCWLTAKDKSKEGRILEFADFLSVLSYIYEEVRSSNFALREHLGSMRDYYAKFEDKSYDFLRPLIEQAKEILFDEVL